jgi:hypothetical protein
MIICSLGKAVKLDFFMAVLHCHQNDLSDELIYYYAIFRGF